MNNILRNKKIIIPAIIAFIVIIVAIVIFIIMGISEKDNKKGNSKIKFGGEETSENTTNTSNQNNVKNEVKGDQEIGEGIDEFYKDAIDKFIAGYMDKEDMETFLEDCVDSKAFLAYENINGDDSKFLDEYLSIEDDNEDIEKITENFKKIPQAYKTLLLMVQAFSEMGNAESSENTTDNTVSEDMKQLSDEDKELKLVSIEEPIKSAGDTEITSIAFKVAFLGEESEITMVFYGETVIYITNEDGDSILEGVGANDFNGNFDFDEETGEE